MSLPCAMDGWSDAHNHVQDERFARRQDDVIEEARRSGVVHMVVNGSAESDWAAVARLAALNPGRVIPAFGWHPWYVHERQPGWQERLRTLLDAVPGTGVGEIGLDRWILECPPAARAGVSPDLAHHVAAPLEEQRVVFGEQMAMAAERNRPASIHCLQAWGPLLEELRNGPRPAVGFLLHSYGGPVEMVPELTRLGAYFGFPGYFLHERKQRHRETFRRIPADRLLVETDAPDQRLPSREERRRVLGDAGLAAEAEHDLTGNDGRPLNHPANLAHVGVGLAAVRGEDVETLRRQVGENFRRLFGEPLETGLGIDAHPPR